MLYLYNSVIFEGATLVYRPDCNAEGGCHANSARAKRGRYWLWQPPEALQEGRYIVTRGMTPPLSNLLNITFHKSTTILMKGGIESRIY